MVSRNKIMDLWLIFLYEQVKLVKMFHTRRILYKLFKSLITDLKFEHFSNELRVLLQP